MKYFDLANGSLIGIFCAAFGLVDSLVRRFQWKLKVWKLLTVAKTRMQDIVVILPGITGSVLQKDGKDIWAVSGQAVWQAYSTLGDSIQQLKLNGDDPEAESLGDGITATCLIKGAHLIPGLDKIDGYTALSHLIIDNFQVIQGDIYNEDKPANFFEFPYDWRRDNRATARLLKRFLDKRLKQWREYTGIKDAKVILLAHSMGGLVSRYYLEVLEGWRDCKALFTFGTPYRGSVNAVNFLANGYKKLFFDLTTVLRSLPSIYQLMPIYEMLKIADRYCRIAEASVELPNIVKVRAEDALKFHREIEAAVESHKKDENYLNSYKIIPMVGTQQPTLQSAELANGQITVSSEFPGLESHLSNGDGTVPYISAIPIELSNDYRDTYIPERHGSIQNNSRVLQELRDRLTTMQVDLSKFRGPEVREAKPSAISLTLDDLYLEDEPIDMRVRLINYQNTGAVKAQIAPVAGTGTLLSVDFRQQEDEWALTVNDLAPGLYRVTVQTGNSSSGAPSPVHDLFEVVK